MNGLVIKSTGSWYDVFLDNGETVSCRLRGQFRIHGIKNTNPVILGDHVTVEMESDHTGLITDILPRRNYIERKATNLSKISHLIAANIDMAFLIVTLKEPRTSLGFIDRFLVSAEGFRIPVTIVFNKIDLYKAAEIKVVDKLSVLYTGIGYRALHTSAVSGLGIDGLRQAMTGKVCLFIGHSGTGKTALINRIDPNLHLRTAEISHKYGKGRHTTTFAKMFPLAGGFMMDTPGIKEFGLIDYSKEEIRDYFPEIRQYNNCCKFDNCLHLHEPDCAVIKAVEAGKIPASRYMNYLAILQDNDLMIADWQLQ